MIAIIFELWPAEGRADDYFGLAAALKSDLERIPGFISVERFQSLADPDKLLSLSSFRDEEAVRAWPAIATRRRRAGKGFSPTIGCASRTSCATMAGMFATKRPATAGRRMGDGWRSPRPACYQGPAKGDQP